MNLLRKNILWAGILILGLMTLFPPVQEVQISRDTTHAIYADNIIHYRFLFTISSVKDIVFVRLLIQYATVISLTLFLTAILKTHKQPEQKSKTKIAKRHPVDEIIYKDE